jgi:hypothetical protein
MKTLLTMFFFTISLNASLVDAVAVTVGDEAITLYEIDNLQYNKRVTKKEATNILIQQKIENILIKEFRISTTDKEVETHIKQTTNQPNIHHVYASLSQRGIDVSEYKQEIKRMLSLKKLYQTIMQSNFKQPTKQELENHYKFHKENFSNATKVSVIRYASANPQELENIIKNPLLQSHYVSRKTLEFDTAKVDPQLAALLNQTPKRQFTPILRFGNGFILLYINDKTSTQANTFENVKKQVLNSFIKQQEEKVIRDFFDRKRKSLAINFLR